MNNSQWYLINTTGHFGYPQPEGNYLKTTYDLSKSCPTCKIGIKQNNEFRFKNEPKASRSHFLSLNWAFDQLFIRDEVKIVFEKEKVTGITFSRPLLHKTGEPLKTIYQLHVDTFVKGGLIADNLEFEICEKPQDKQMLDFLTAIKSSLVSGPFCGKKKYNFPQDNKLSFKKIALENQPDFVRVAEWFGSGGSAQQPILVSEKIKNLIEYHTWRGISLTPVLQKQ